MKDWRRVQDLADYVDQDVTVLGWVVHHRSSGRIQFLTIRDGTGEVQAVVRADSVSAEAWDAAEALAQEASVSIAGRGGAGTPRPPPAGWNCRRRMCAWWETRTSTR
jgi:aspartyl/asparaginyl-tRNA synthetase